MSCSFWRTAADELAAAAECGPKAYEVEGFGCGLGDFFLLNIYRRCDMLRAGPHCHAAKSTVIQ